MAALDPQSAVAVEALVTGDPEFAKLVKQVAAQALKTQLYFLKFGSPDQRLSVARGFLPVFAKALTGEKSDRGTEDMLAETRALISGILPAKDE